jgi:type IV fimbrial biogenesis protein FimT
MQYLHGADWFTVVWIMRISFAYNGAGRSCAAGNSLAAHWGTLSPVQGRATRNIKINMLGRVRGCDPQVQTSGCDNAAD